MSLANMCPPALLYLAFSLTHIIIDTFRRHYSTAFTKFIVMTIFTLVLNIMCERGLGIISWVIVFLPFILMTYITAVLMYVFGLQPASSQVPAATPENQPTIDPRNTQQHHQHHHVPPKKKVCPNPSCTCDSGTCDGNCKCDESESSKSK
mgnify:CR=1 FL=1|tara:strand:+ start:81 stop:530 length:450 start_codon:yes stop_codon:yes gene_type:complete